MKKILTILTILFLTSCSNDYIEDNKSLINSKKETTLEILEKIDTSSQLYHIVVDGGTLYAINKETKTVEYKIVDNSGGLGALLLLSLMCFLFIFIFIIITLDI